MIRMAVIVSGRGVKSVDSIGVMSRDTPPVIVGGIGEPGEFVIKGPAPLPHPPLKASPILKGIVRGQSRRVSVRPNPADVERSIHEIKTRHLRPAPPVAPARIHDSAADSPVVVKPSGWRAQPPTYPPKLGATPFLIRPAPLVIPFKEPKPKIVMPKNIIYGGGARADEPVPSRILVNDITKGPFEVKIRDYSFGLHKTHKSSVVL